jgi:tetraacyldisaccharide 4'-kinase
LRAVLHLGETLERGTLRVPFSGLLAGAWRLAMTRTLRRNLRLPAHVRVLAIGGATLGGSGKTPLAIACAAELARQGASAVLVGHAYKAAPRFARVVADGDSVEDVGDEALMASRALRASGARVVVAPTRQAAIDLGATLGRVLVVDGVSQTAPVSASLALLALDAAEPWGSRQALPPRGDLRASPAELIEVCDVVVPFGDLPDPTSAEWCGISGKREGSPARAEGAGAHLTSGELLSWDALADTPVGLITTLARPDRLVRSLAARGVYPRLVLRGSDHGPSPARLGRRASSATKDAGIALWLATAKCSIHLERLERAADRDARALLGAPRATLEHRFVLSGSLVARLHRLAAP